MKNRTKQQRCFVASPKRSLGQHFLVHPNTARWIAKQADIAPKDFVIEIGPGKGILTRALLEKHARVIAIEKDEALYELLKTRMGDTPGLTLLKGDAVSFPWRNITSKENPAILLGNLPYNVSTQILWNLLPLTGLFQRWLFLFQKEVAERICASPGSRPYGALSVFTQSVTRPELVRVFPPRFFMPPPKVDSALVSFKMFPLNSPTPMENKNFVRVVKAAFAHRRKMLRNNLKPLFGGDVHALESLLNAIGLKGTLRAQNLTVRDYIRLASILATDKHR